MKGYDARLMDDNSQKTEITRKRLLWRATHRGIKEMDIVVGGFAQSRLADMSTGELALFEVLLEIPDQELLSWTTGQESVPEKWNTPLLHEMIEFRPKLI
jgi:antitoxin CptB